MNWSDVSKEPEFIKTVGEYSYSRPLLLWIEGVGPDFGVCMKLLSKGWLIWSPRNSGGRFVVSHWAEIKSPSGNEV